MNELAELKLLKVVEPLTDNADGNREPSKLESSSWACVETRREVCIQCGGAISPTKYKNAKYCSSKCSNLAKSRRYEERSGRTKMLGVGSGGNQWEENNTQYKGGKATYSRRAFEYYGKICNRCGSTDYLVVHHKNHNRSDNYLDNLEVLCKSCHQRHHENRDELGRYTKG